MKMRKIAAFAAFLGLTAAASVQAAKQESRPFEGISKANVEQAVRNLKGACKDDLNKYCKDVTPGEGRIAACLDSREDKLSVVCKSAWSGTKAEVSKRVDQAEVAFRKSCGSDVKKYCAEVPSGGGRLMDCLDEHKDHLSNSCEKYHAAYEQKLAEFVG